MTAIASMVCSFYLSVAAPAPYYLSVAARAACLSVAARAAFISVWQHVHLIISVWPHVQFIVSVWQHVHLIISVWPHVQFSLSVAARAPYYLSVASRAASISVWQHVKLLSQCGSTCSLGLNVVALTMVKSDPNRGRNSSVGSVLGSSCVLYSVADRPYSQPPVEGIIPLELTWVLTPYPNSSFG